MSKPLIAACNQCNNITMIEFKEKKHPKGVRETYFECDICNHHYTCFVTDKKVRQMQTKAKNLRVIAKVRNVKAELDELQNKINNRMRELKQNLISNTP